MEFVRLRPKTKVFRCASGNTGFYKDEMSDYYYIGDRFTDTKFKGAECNAVRRIDRKCIRGKNGSMLVEFNGGKG